MDGLINIVRAAVDSMMRFWQVLISGIPTLKALREGYGGIQGPGETCIAPIEGNCGWGRCFGVAHLGVFLGRILLDTVVYVGAMERFNHSRTPVLGRFVESCGRGQRLEKSSLELCGGCNKIPSPGVPVTVHFGGLDGGSLYVLSHTHLRDPHPWPGFIQQAF